MRLNDFSSVDELVDVGIIEFEKRAFAPKLNWTPSRQSVYQSQSNKYPKMLMDIIDRVSFDDIIKSDINPSLLIKSAQDYQLSARIARLDKDTIIKYFLALANVGMKLKRYYYYDYCSEAVSLDYCHEKSSCKEIEMLNGLLRAFSETIYFDDHTISGEFYGEIKNGIDPVVVRSYKRLCPKDFLPCFKDFTIEKVESFCLYDSDKMDFDCLGNISFIDKKRPATIGFCVKCTLIDGTVKTLNTINEISDLLALLEDQLKITYDYYSSMSLFEKRKALLSSSFYAYKPLLMVMGKTWQPTNEDIKLYIDSLDNKTEYDKSEESKNLDYRRIVDPRMDL